MRQMLIFCNVKEFLNAVNENKVFFLHVGKWKTADVSMKKIRLDGSSSVKKDNCSCIAAIEATTATTVPLLPILIGPSAISFSA